MNCPKCNGFVEENGWKVFDVLLMVDCIKCIDCGWYKIKK